METISTAQSRRTTDLAYAVFTELGTKNVEMKPGSNVRVFNRVQVGGEMWMTYDENTGTLTLSPGVYRIDGYSITTFGYMLTKEQQSAVRSVPGYAYFYDLDQKSIAILGSMQDAIYAFPSHVNDILTVPGTTRFQLGHQNGDKVDGVFLETYDEAARSPDNPSAPSINHVFAKLVVERLADAPEPL